VRMFCRVCLVLKHQLDGVSKSIEERLIKSMAERMVKKVVPKLL
jgi:hypothetical protein